MKKVISIINHKGGVGKTTTAVNLSKALALSGHKVLMIDIDPQGNLSQNFGFENPSDQLINALVDGKLLPVQVVDEGLFLVPSGIDLIEAESSLVNVMSGIARLKRALAPVRNEYDYVIIDCPPSLNILSQNAIIASDSVIVAVEPTKFASSGLDRMFELIKDAQHDMNEDLKIEGILFTMVDNRLAIQKYVQQLVSETFDDLPVFETVIRRNVALQEASFEGKDVFAHAPKSYGAEDYEALAKEILQKEVVNG
ncbi:ParA family protein [Aureibacter tunicatorum]|uniref:Chromosome partitioning protein n=1 Tax=Aureibacter tunicatorum TaxID=866807 RepID=A0AAE4BUS8_9BACT|nr:ParA family protein [Aureibacter tunicatorum]MDR6242081.1 chromosome partitioning protein [Aureibacter tunicatorum]BDD07566.1 hypothetical protein AUTU_50490 [Aureibacter tunicatorum]